MITAEFVRLMGRYNAWQNASIYNAAASLTDAARREERGAFFGSIHATLNHLCWADQVWLHRLIGSPLPRARSIPESLAEYADWEELGAARARTDVLMRDMHQHPLLGELADDLTWSALGANRTSTRPKWKLVVHLFNHGTHHRGQVHCMLTAAGARPDDTDIPMMPENFAALADECA